VPRPFASTLTLNRRRPTTAAITHEVGRPFHAISSSSAGKEEMNMEYTKPELTPLASAIEAVQSATMKHAVPIDSNQQSAAGAYDADE